jgi:hypothetical protein
MPEPYSFNGTEGKPIDLQTARQWAANYRAQNPGQTTAHFFGRDILNKILSEPDCLGIRLYYAIDDATGKQLIAVGAVANGDNLLPGSGNNNVLGDASFPCPPYCASNSL